MAPGGSSSWRLPGIGLTGLLSVACVVLGLLLTPVNSAALVAALIGLLLLRGLLDAAPRPAATLPRLLLASVLAPILALASLLKVLPDALPLLTPSGWLVIVLFFLPDLLLVLLGTWTSLMVLRTRVVLGLVAMAPAVMALMLAWELLTTDWDFSLWSWVPVAALAAAAVTLAVAAGRRREPEARRPLSLQRVLLGVALVTVFLWWHTAARWHVLLYRNLGWDFLAAVATTRLREGPGSEELRAETLLRGGHPEVAELVSELELWPWRRCAPLEDCVGPASLGEVPEGFSPVQELAGYSLAWQASMRGALRRAVLAPRVLPEDGVPAAQLDWFPMDHPWPEGGLTVGMLMGLAAYHLQQPEADVRILSGSLSYQMVRELALAHRLGHCPWLLYTDAARTTVRVGCLYCGTIAGPATGVTEHPDGALTWQREDGTTVRVPPATWLSGWTPPERPRPTMPAPDR